MVSCHVRFTLTQSYDTRCSKERKNRFSCIILRSIWYFISLPNYHQHHIFTCISFVGSWSILYRFISLANCNNSLPLYPQLFFTNVCDYSSLWQYSRGDCMDGPIYMPGVARVTPDFRSRSTKRFQNCHFYGMCNSQIFFDTFVSYGVTLVSPILFLCNTLLKIPNPSLNDR